MKRKFLFAFSLLTVASLAACGNGDGPKAVSVDTFNKKCVELSKNIDEESLTKGLGIDLGINVDASYTQTDEKDTAEITVKGSVGFKADIVEGKVKGVGTGDIKLNLAGSEMPIAWSSELYMAPNAAQELSLYSKASLTLGDETTPLNAAYTFTPDEANIAGIVPQLTLGMVSSLIPSLLPSVVTEENIKTVEGLELYASGSKGDVKLGVGYSEKLEGSSASAKATLSYKKGVAANLSADVKANVTMPSETYTEAIKADVKAKAGIYASTEKIVYPSDMLNWTECADAATAAVLGICPIAILFL